MASVRAARPSILALAYANATVHCRYWLSVVPQIRREARGWHGRAQKIPDPTLRRLALESLLMKESNVEGAAAFAILAPRRHRGAVLLASSTFQCLYDYLDTISEQPSEDPIENAEQLHRALLVALNDDAPHLDYYARHSSGDDNQYLLAMIEVCRSQLRALPSYRLIADLATGMSERFVRYQSLNLSAQLTNHGALARWAREQTPAGSGLRWWETAAATGSSLGLFALFAAAASPKLSPSECSAIEEAYWPWVGALHILLDSVADEALDDASGQPSLLDYYVSPQESADRMHLLASEALHRTSDLRKRHQHQAILAGMVASYLSSAEPLSARAQLISDAVLEAMGATAKPGTFIFRARRDRAGAGRGPRFPTGRQAPWDASASIPARR